MNVSPEWVAEPPGWRLGVLQLKVLSAFYSCIVPDSSEGYQTT